LDEPTIGLHPRDNGMLLKTLKKLEHAGNSVLVVEHDEATIDAADIIIALGRVPESAEKAHMAAAAVCRLDLARDPRREGAQFKKYRRQAAARRVELR